MCRVETASGNLSTWLWVFHAQTACVVFFLEQLLCSFFVFGSDNLAKGWGGMVSERSRVKPGVSVCMLASVNLLLV